MFCTQVTGKKNRPAMHLSILCEHEKVETIARVLFKHTSTAGLRYHKVDRIIMTREMVTVKVENESVRVKKTYV